MAACEFQALLFQTETVTVSNSLQVRAGLWKWQLELHRMSLGALGQQLHPSLYKLVKGSQGGAGCVQTLQSYASTVEIL